MLESRLFDKTIVRSLVTLKVASYKKKRFMISLQYCIFSKKKLFNGY